MTSKIFNFLRFMAETGITAIGAAYLGLALIWHWGYGEEISKSCVVISTLLGIFVGVKRVAYNKNNNPSCNNDAINPEAEEQINGI